MKRQVGSTFKPFVYLTALIKGEDPAGIAYGPGYPAEDAPWRLLFDRGKQSWSPKNYEKEYLGWITLRGALAHSINTVTARLGVQVGIENVIQTARRLGIESELPAVPSLSLGVAELSPVELLRAYAVIANHGIQDELTVIRAITQSDGTTYARFIYHPNQVIDPAPIDLLTDMLQSVFTEGTAKTAAAMGFDRPAAGKTGTTSHHRDSWFAGFTPQLTTVVWVGMDQTPTGGKTSVNGDDDEEDRPHIALTGGTSALPIWATYMQRALERDPPEAFPLSPYLTDVQIDLHSGKQAAMGCPSNQVIMDKYIRGKEPRDTACEPEFPPTVMHSDL
jgi:membrane peptidoglycan carboxypeptidase